MRRVLRSPEKIILKFFTVCDQPTDRQETVSLGTAARVSRQVLDRPTLVSIIAIGYHWLLSHCHWKIICPDVVSRLLRRWALLLVPHGRLLGSWHPLLIRFSTGCWCSIDSQCVVSWCDSWQPQHGQPETLLLHFLSLGACHAATV